MSERGEGRRHLKAIMFTDIKDYSAKMSRDERRTVELVLAHREIVRETLPAYQGEEHEIIGDAFVVLFDSVVNAVHCGVEIQRRLAAWNAERPPEEQVWIRIGIHLGDIIMRDGGGLRRRGQHRRAGGAARRAGRDLPHRGGPPPDPRQDRLRPRVPGPRRAQEHQRAPAGLPPARQALRGAAA